MTSTQSKVNTKHFKQWLTGEASSLGMERGGEKCDSGKTPAEEIHKGKGW